MSQTGKRLLHARTHLMRYTSMGWNTATQLTKSVHPTRFYSLKNNVWLQSKLILQQYFTHRGCKRTPDIHTLSIRQPGKTCNLLEFSLCNATFSVYANSDTFLLKEIQTSLLSQEDRAIADCLNCKVQNQRQKWATTKSTTCRDELEWKIARTSFWRFAYGDRASEMNLSVASYNERQRPISTVLHHAYGRMETAVLVRQI